MKRHLAEIYTRIWISYMFIYKLTFSNSLQEVKHHSAPSKAFPFVKTIITPTLDMTEYIRIDYGPDFRIYVKCWIYVFTLLVGLVSNLDTVNNVA